jgi:hypothetical protein
MPVGYGHQQHQMQQMQMQQQQQQQQLQQQQQQQQMMIMKGLYKGGPVGKLPGSASKQTNKHPPSGVAKAGTKERDDSAMLLLKKRDLVASKLAVKEKQDSVTRMGGPPQLPRLKSHWDYLLDEMQWMAVDYRQERRWKMSEAHSAAIMCAEAVGAQSSSAAVAAAMGLAAQDADGCGTGGSSSASSGRADEAATGGGRVTKEAPEMAKLDMAVVREKQKAAAQRVAALVGSHWDAFGTAFASVGEGDLPGQGKATPTPTGDPDANRILAMNKQAIDVGGEASEAMAAAAGDGDVSDGVDMAAFALAGPEQNAYRQVLSLNNAGLGAALYGDKFSGKTYAMACCVHTWLSAAEPAVNGHGAAVLILCSRRNLRRWQFELERQCKDERREVVVWAHRQSLFSAAGAETGPEAESPHWSKAAEEDVHRADIVLCAIETYIAQVKRRRTCGSAGALPVAESRPWSGVLVDVRDVRDGLGIESGVRKLVVDGETQCGDKTWLLTLAKAVSDSSPKRCIVSERSLTGTGSRNSVLMGPSDPAVAAGLLAFLVPQVFQHDALGWVNWCQTRAKVNEAEYQKPFDVLTQLDICASLPSHGGGGGSATATDDSPPSVIREETVSLDMDQLQRKKYINVMEALVSQSAFAGDDVQLVAQACVLLRRTCFHEGLVCLARPGLHRKSHALQQQRVLDRLLKQQGRVALLSTPFTGDGASTDLLSLGRQPMNGITASAAAILNAIASTSDCAMSTPMAAAFRRVEPFSANVAVPQRLLLPMRRFAPGLFRSNLECPPELVLSGRKKRVMGSCKLRALKGILDVYKGLRIVVLTETDDEHCLVHQHLQELSVKHFFTEVASAGMDIGGPEGGIAWFSAQEAIATFNASSGPSLLVAKTAIFDGSGLLPVSSDVVVVLSENWAKQVDVAGAFRLAKSAPAAPVAERTTKPAGRGGSGGGDGGASSGSGAERMALTVVRVVAKSTVEEAFVQRGGSLGHLQGGLLKGIHNDQLANQIFQHAATHAHNADVLGVVPSPQETSPSQVPAHFFTVVPAVLSLAPALGLAGAGTGVGDDEAMDTDGAPEAAAGRAEAAAATNATRGAGVGKGKGKGVVMRSGSDGDALSLFRRRPRVDDPSYAESISSTWVQLLGEVMDLMERHFQGLVRGGELAEPKPSPQRTPVSISVLAKIGTKSDGTGMTPGGAGGVALASPGGAALGSYPESPFFCSSSGLTSAAAVTDMDGGTASALGLGESGRSLALRWSGDALLDFVMAISRPRPRSTDGSDGGGGGSSMSAKLLALCASVACQRRMDMESSALRNPVYVSDDDTELALKADGVGCTLAEHMVWSLRQVFSFSEEQIRQAAREHAEDNVTNMNRAMANLPGGMGQVNPVHGTQGGGPRMPGSLPVLETFRSTVRSLKRHGVAVDPHLSAHPLQAACKSDVVYYPSSVEKEGHNSLVVQIQYRETSGRPQRRTNKIQSRVDAKRRALDVPLQVELAAPELKQSVGNHAPHHIRGSYSARPIFVPRRPPKLIRETEIHSYEKWTAEEDDTIECILSVFGEEAWMLAEYVLNSRPQTWGRVRSARQVRERHLLLEANNMLATVRDRAKPMEATLRAKLDEIHRTPDIEGLTSWLLDRARTADMNTAAAAGMEVEEERPIMSTEDALAIELAAHGVEALTEDVKKEEEPVEEEVPIVVTAGTGRVFEGAPRAVRKQFATRRGAMMDVTTRRPPVNFMASYKIGEGGSIASAHASHSTAVTSMRADGQLSAFAVIDGFNIKAGVAEGKPDMSQSAGGSAGSSAPVFAAPAAPDAGAGTVAAAVAAPAPPLAQSGTVDGSA